MEVHIVDKDGMITTDMSRFLRPQPMKRTFASNEGMLTNPSHLFGEDT